MCCGPHQRCRVALGVELPAEQTHSSGPNLVRTKFRKASVNFVSQNCRGMKSSAREAEFWETFRQRGFLAACLQETWRKDNGEVDVVGYGKLLVSSKGVQCRRGSAGVAIALSRKGVDAWEKGGSQVVAAGDGRIIGARLLLKDARGVEVGVFLVSAYAPVGTAAKADWDEFLDALDMVIGKCKKDDVLMIGIDSNSSMGSGGGGHRIGKVMGRFGNGHINDAGRRFMAFLAIRGLSAPSTFFRKRDYSTWCHPRSKNMH
jgi:hypothetical protein